MTKTKDTIEGLVYISKVAKLHSAEKEHLFNAIQILKAQEQAEGMLPEKKKAILICDKCEHQVVLRCVQCFSLEEQQFNQAISIAQTILAKKILENEYLEKSRQEVLKGFNKQMNDIKEKDKRIKELEEEIAEYNEKFKRIMEEK